MSTLAKRIIFIATVAVILGIFIAGNIVCGIYADVITTALHGDGTVFDSEDVARAQAEGDELCQELTGEGIVLYKNANNALPLKESERKLNVMGWSSSDSGFLLRGVGSGSSTIRDSARVTFLEGLTSRGFQYNTEITALYKGERDNQSAAYRLTEPSLSVYTDDIMENAKDFSDIAVIVLSRQGGENIGEIPTTQSNDNSRTYLQISRDEEALLDLADRNFNKVIVIINSCNYMHLSFLEDDRVDAALFVGLPGQSGTKAIADVLKGDINPSGRVTDIHVFDPKQDPTWQNKAENKNHIQYVDDIYYGYKWYETAHEEGFFRGRANDYGSEYDAVVQFPFGYGLSYTNFEWKVDGMSVPSGSTITKDSTFEITVSVTNKGSLPGKDVVQVYYTPPYTKGEIEKAHVNLLAFAKTDVIKAGETQKNIKLTFNMYDMASYDCYDKNNNGYATYELDRGLYEIKLMNNSHIINDCTNSLISYRLMSTAVFDKDPVTGTAVENRYTDEGAYAGVPIDGSTVGATKTYLSRADFEGTFPSARATAPTNTALVTQAARYVNPIYDNAEMPVFDQDNGIKLVRKVKYEKDEAGEYLLDEDDNKVITEGSLEDMTLAELNGSLTGDYEIWYNEELISELVSDFNSDKWDGLLDQLSAAEVKDVVENGGFKTRALESVGKPLCRDYDGPAGFNASSQGTSGEWTAYPSQTLIGCTFSRNSAYLMGLAMGKEAAATNLSGWYAPGVNLHRSPYTARNFEYYSEDGLLSGKLAAEVIRGAKTNGLYCYIKHFAVSEPGPNPRKLNTWLTEQNLRENYLKPFEIAVKEGGANGVMTAFNNIGGTWAGANYPLNVSILREEWGFKGTVVTDYAMKDNISIGEMNPKQGIRAGNDIWLNPASAYNNLSTSDAVDMYCAKLAVKNVLYTFIETYDYSVSLDRGITEPVFPLWIPLLIAGEVLIVAGLAVWGVFTFKPRKMTAEAA